MTRRHFFIIPLFILLFGVQGAIAASIAITPAGNGTFIIQGNGMDGVAGIQLNVKYDTTSLASPSVVQGSLVSGGMLAANTNNPGSINIAIINTKPFSGSGQVASISFATHTGTGSITVSSSMINSKGAPVAGGGTANASDFQNSTAGSSGAITTPGVPFSQPGASTTSTGSASTTAAPASTTPTYLGTVNMPADVLSENNKKTADTTSVPVQVTEPETGIQDDPPADVKPVAVPQKPEKVKITSYSGPLENFRTYKGERSPAIFVALFNREITPTIRQEPAVVLSDGKTPVKIWVKLETAGDKSPNFSLNGAKLVSLITDASSAWIIEALPKAGTLQATLTILTETDLIEYPLTLAPPVAGVSSTETDFAVFLSDSGAVTPKRDLNGDGRHDYLDDFIYTANFLIKKGASGKIMK